MANAHAAPPPATIERTRSNVDVLAWSIAAVVLIAHALVAGRYDAFRNELYFIVCGRHPAFGYVDQPPLVPLLAALTQITGENVWLLRLPAVLAAALLVPLTVSFARTLGATTRGAWLASAAAAGAPLLIGITTTLGTSTFEPIAWTLVAYAIARALLRDESRMLIVAGVVAGIASEAKYGIVLWLIGIAIGLACTRGRRAFAKREFWIGTAAMLAIALPNVIWQATNAFPFLEVVRNDNAGNFTGSPIGFTIGQLVALNLVLAPLWIAGVVAPFANAARANVRFLAIAFLVTFALVFLTHGKNYYLAGAYPTMFAIGAAACSRLPRIAIGAWLAVASANAALGLPLVAPVLSPDGLARYIARLPVKPRPMEAAGVGAPLTQVFSDEFGWRELETTVARVYRALPEADRAKTAIIASNYGEAAAIDVYGVADRLPSALSEQNQYYLWGTHGYDGSVVIAVNARPAFWARACRESSVVATFGVPYAMPYERDRNVILCRGTVLPLDVPWPRFKRYGL